MLKNLLEILFAMEIAFCVKNMFFFMNFKKHKISK